MLREILSLCHEHGVLVHHCYNSRLCIGDGYPDLILIGKHSILFTELKTEGGNLTSSQTTWRYRITAAGGKWVIWRPSDLDHAESIIAGL